uniref:Uncharacterized protein n=1 Tax=Anguilla anguilla TaxID=7936 RepID=A0A0E9QY01_ANGAN
MYANISLTEGNMLSVQPFTLQVFLFCVYRGTWNSVFTVI